jgi:hypothetical protein
MGNPAFSADSAAFDPNRTWTRPRFRSAAAVSGLVEVWFYRSCYGDPGSLGRGQRSAGQCVAPSGRRTENTAANSVEFDPISGLPEIEILFGAEKFDERRAEPTQGWVVMITLVPKNANVKGRYGYR